MAPGGPVSTLPGGYTRWPRRGKNNGTDRAVSVAVIVAAVRKVRSRRWSQGSSCERVGRTVPAAIARRRGRGWNRAGPPFPGQTQKHHLRQSRHPRSFAWRNGRKNRTIVPAIDSAGHPSLRRRRSADAANSQARLDGDVCHPSEKRRAERSKVSRRPPRMCVRCFPCSEGSPVDTVQRAQPDATIASSVRRESDRRRRVAADPAHVTNCPHRRCHPGADAGKKAPLHSSDLCGSWRFKLPVRTV